MMPCPPITQLIREFTVVLFFFPCLLSTKYICMHASNGFVLWFQCVLESARVVHARLRGKNWPLDDGWMDG